MEQRRWKEQLKSGERDPGKIYVLLQHDVDRLPERTMILLRHERDLAIPSTVQVFKRLVNRRHLKLTGQIEYKDYPLDDELMRDLEANHRFVIGYHNNAYEQALFDRELATQIFTNNEEVIASGDAEWSRTAGSATPLRPADNPVRHDPEINADERDEFEDE